MVNGAAEKDALNSLPRLSNAFMHWHVSGSQRSLGGECVLVQGPYLVCS